MKNKNKGFTLIELLVVVAIIGILAAVGTVAYTGYTASAKKNASKTLHSQAAKYIAAEIQKCTLDSDAKAMGGAIQCDGTVPAKLPTADIYAQAYVDSGVKNPYKPSDPGAKKEDAGEEQGVLYLTVNDDNEDIVLTMTPKTGDAKMIITITVE